jgi:hypothetical protein
MKKLKLILILLIILLGIGSNNTCFAQNNNDELQEYIIEEEEKQTVNEPEVAVEEQAVEDYNTNENNISNYKKQSVVIEEARKNDNGIQQRNINTNAWNNEKSKPEYNYVLDDKKEVAKQKVKKENKKIDSPKFDWRIDKDTQVILTYLFIAIALVLIFYALLGKRFFNQADIPIEETVVLNYENVTEFNDWENAIKDAMIKEDYRLAVRIMYLQTLKKLDDKIIVAFKQDMPNGYYLQKLFSTNYYPPFKELVKYFDYTWYGNYSITREQCSSIWAQFITFNQSMI